MRNARTTYRSFQGNSQRPEGAHRTTSLILSQKLPNVSAVYMRRFRPNTPFLATPPPTANPSSQSREAFARTPQLQNLNCPSRYSNTGEGKLESKACLVAQSNARGLILQRTQYIPSELEGNRGILVFTERTSKETRSVFRRSHQRGYRRSL
jgi:hypothetical protein